MLKLYAVYLIAGLFLFRSIIIIIGPNAAENITNGWMNLSLISATVMFSTASVISLYKPKTAVTVAVIALAGMFPLIWVMFGIGITQFAAWGIITLVGYFAVLTMSLIVMYKQKIVVSKVNKGYLLVLSILPVAILIFLAVLGTMHWG